MVKVKMCKSDVTIECTPDTEIEFEWDEVKAAIQALELSGVQWAPDFALQEFVFGLKKLIVVCQIIDNMVPTTTVVTDALAKIKGIGGAEMTSIETAGSDWAKEAKEAAKKGIKNEAAEKQASKKSKKKKEKKEVVRVIDDAMIAAATAKVCVQVKEATYFVTGVPEVDGSGQTNVTREHLEKVMEGVRAKSPEVALMLVAAGSNQVAALVSIPASKVAECSAIEWVKGTPLSAGNPEGDANTAFAVLECSIEADQFPIKIKDECSAHAFNYLKKQGVMGDESEDELYGNDDEAY